VANADYSRREFVFLLGCSAATVLGCNAPTVVQNGSARLEARPGTPSGSATPGLVRLMLGASRDGHLLVPQSYDPQTPTPLVLALHGAGGSANGPLAFLGPYAESYGFLLLAVDSLGITWDAIRGNYDTDVLFIDRALGETFDRCAVDPARIVVEGFSDGASYALGLGLANGDLFSRVVAFSPGFIPPSDSPPLGRPEIFVSHGRQDPVLPIDSTSRVIVATLQQAGHPVTYLEFDGGHEVPAAVADDAVRWLLR
jgi:phospholipase/carboxylesterase